MNKIGLGHELNISQTLEMMLSPRMIQMLNILNLPYMELVQEIEKASEDNVMLELEKPDRLLEFLRQIADNRIPKKEIPGEDLPGIESLAETSMSLEAHIMNQLNLEDLDDNQRRTAEMLVEAIDENGYIKDYKGACASITKETGATQDEIEEALSVIQALDPEGVGARDLKECLLIQVREHNFETYELEALLEKVIKDHLEDLASKNFDKIAKALKIKKDGVEYIAEFIRVNLNPNPGAKFTVKAPCVIPSFFIKKENDKFVAVNLEKTYGPTLKISPQYEKMLADPTTNAESVKYLKERLQAAKDFLENIEKRNVTIQKIMDRIISTQNDFLEKGEACLSPLMQKDIADEFGLHPSTISRAIANKYIQTPRGVFQVKFLCPREVKGLTSENIKRKISGIISSENKGKPLSDDDIAARLLQEGIKLKRRTVAGYRKKLGLEIAGKRVKFPADSGDNKSGKL